MSLVLLNCFFLRRLSHGHLCFFIFLYTQDEAWIWRAGPSNIRVAYLSLDGGKKIQNLAEIHK